jgi:hypothetical protein
MAHHSMEKWIDFARGVLGEQESAAMQTHLETGCKQCSEAVNLWRHVYEIARQDQAFEPPESAVRTIKGSFAIHGPRRQQSRAAAVVKLLFDSALAPAQAGIRSSASTSRQLLFGLGSYRLDLHMEPQSDSDRVSVTGQILHAADLIEGTGTLPVALVKGRKVVAETLTSRFGEFSLECERQGQFHLRIKLPGEELQLALVDPIPSGGTQERLITDSKGFTRSRKPKKRRTKG